VLSDAHAHSRRHVWPPPGKQPMGSVSLQ
jgi:hypothetical protein